MVITTTFEISQLRLTREHGSHRIERHKVRSSPVYAEKQKQRQTATLLSARECEYEGEIVLWLFLMGH